MDDVHVTYVDEKKTAFKMMATISQKKKIIDMKYEQYKPLAAFFNVFESAIRAYKNAGGIVDDLEVVTDLLMAMTSKLFFEVKLKRAGKFITTDF